jgi:hypothetical protein
MTPHPVDPHLTPDEVELWAEGLLGTARVMHLPDCAQCLALAQRERRLFLGLAQLPRLAPEFGFADRVMARVRVPTPSDKFGA